MIWSVAAIGKPKLPFARDGIEEYARRIASFTRIEIHWVKSGPGESDRLLKAAGGHLLVALDPRGAQVSSEELAARIATWQNASTTRIGLVVGGADGLADPIRHAANWTWSLGKITLQHELALLVALEQIYRAYAILNHLPYHR